MTWLITGADGFLGSHLAEALAADGIEVHGTVRTPPSRGTTNGGAAVAHHECDIRDVEQVSAVISAVHPTTICHLAAQSSPTESWIDATETFNTNAGGLVRVLDAVRATVPDSLVLAVGSSAEYGPSSGPIAEDHPQVPGTPYGVSKVAQDLIAALYHAHYGMRTVRLRPFFVVGPRKTGDVSSDLAKRVVAVEDGTSDTVTVGNLDAIRDLLDVRDAVAPLFFFPPPPPPPLFFFFFFFFPPPLLFFFFFFFSSPLSRSPSGLPRLLLPRGGGFFGGGGGGLLPFWGCPFFGFLEGVGGFFLLFGGGGGGRALLTFVP